MKEFEYVTEDRTILIQHAFRTGEFTMKDLHMHHACELYFLFRGERDYFIRDRIWRVRAGDFVFIGKNELHRTIDTGAPEHERAVFYFSERLFQPLPPPLRAVNGVIRLPEKYRQRGEELAREIVAESMGNLPGRDAMIEAMLRQLLLMVFRAAQGTETGEAGETAPSAVQRMMSEIASFIAEHCAEPLTLESVADRFFISPYHLSRKFKQCTGFGFHEYLQQVRVREAKRLLLETDLKMIDIAERTGFGQAASFHRLFKRIVGLTPLQYRKRHRADLAV